MNLQVIVNKKMRVHEARLSVSKSGAAHLNKRALELIDMATVGSVNVIQDQDDDKNFFVKFFSDDSGQTPVHAYKDKVEFFNSQFYIKAKESFSLRENKTLKFKLGNLVEIAPGLKAYPLLINTSELL
ncbi:MAG: hypothetical protein KKC03_01160 [Bacteroidetes bacterium]|nr:hypothetical protein [Bacteroidota bacterium]